MVGWLVCCLIGCLVGLVGWLVGCFVGWLVAWLLACLVAWLLGWWGHLNNKGGHRMNMPCVVRGVAVREREKSKI